MIMHIVALVDRQQVVQVVLEGLSCRATLFQANGDDMHELESQVDCSLSEALIFINRYIDPVPALLALQLREDNQAIQTPGACSGVCFWDSEGNLVLDDRKRHN
jgi:hypothetical protein